MWDKIDPSHRAGYRYQSLPLQQPFSQPPMTSIAIPFHPDMKTAKSGTQEGVPGFHKIPNLLQTCKQHLNTVTSAIQHKVSQIKEGMSTPDLPNPTDYAVNSLDISSIEIPSHALIGCTSSSDISPDPDEPTPPDLATVETPLITN